MKRLQLLAAFLIVSLVSPLRGDDAKPAELKAGAATSNITPELGLAIVGGFAPFPSTSIHDDLHARCLVLDNGQTKIALVVCDLLGLQSRISTEARKLIEEKTGIPSANVLISGTHTHSASSTLGQNRYRTPDKLDPYQAFVARRIADGVQTAAARLRPAEIGVGTVEIPEHVFNRRWFMQPGKMPANPFGEYDQVKMNPPSGSANLDRPAGPTDPIVSILSVREPNGRPISVFTAYSLHYVGGVAGAQISADYYGMYCHRLGRLLGTDDQDPPFVAMMANGTSGDINNINFREPRPRKAAYEQMRYVADDVAAKVHAELPKLTYRRDVQLDARYDEPALKWRHPTEKERKWAIETLENRPEVPGKTDLSRIYAERVMNLIDLPETTPVPLQILRIGDACVGTMPCEVFCEIGLEFRKRCKAPTPFMVSINHGYMGYLPTPAQHELGGYETWIGTNRLEREASVKMLDRLIEMAESIKDQ
ncbi:Neutral/alkaline non-lysosomal ceramidase [Caulifigura coniformis]|uniref:Neutral/alkaline non-lysosomal ceramidase n=2 Tax=Caulifigura coniformis TaxID=2527983 RepID=A0A517SB33_9PLAN|nr:Neutral/alkaline non-lysosomal ceramidase [Caulifigura coniformis]